MINLRGETNELAGIKGVVDLFPEKAEKGVARISKYEFDSKKDIFYNLRASRDMGGIFYMYTGQYVRLHINNRLMMSDTAMERKTNRAFVNNAKGRVLIAGLGVGLIIQAIIDKEEVTEVVVIEKYQDVIDLVEPIFKHPKLKVICADIFEYDMPKEEKFDTIYFDIWAEISIDNLEQMKRLHAKYRRNKRSQDAWMHSWMKDELKKERAKEYRNKYW